MQLRGWRDAWLELHPEPVVGSEHTAGFTFSQDNPRKRIDFVFVVGDELQVSSMRTFGADPEEWPSDHLGLLLKLKWNV